jgi:biopolymer transport protein TolR
MVRRPMQRHPELATDGGPALSLTPIINLVLLLTAALLLATSWLATSSLVVVAPRIDPEASAAVSAPTSERAPLNLTIVITDQGFYLATSGRVLSANLTDTTVVHGPTVPRRADGSYDFSELAAKLTMVKDAFPEEDRVVISAEPEIGYGVLVQTMSVARHGADRGELFADIVLSADVG